MLALITKLDGVNVALFHVEQNGDSSPSGRWCFRLACGDDAWGDEVEVLDLYVVWPLPSFGRPVRCQWRPVVAAGESVEWRDAVPMIYGENVACRMVVARDEPFEVAGDPFHFCAAVRGFPSVWELRLPAGIFAENGPEKITVDAISLCSGPGQVLAAPGDFQLASGGWKVANADPSQAALLPAWSSLPEKQAIAGSWMVVTGRMSAEELDQLLKEEVG